MGNKSSKKTESASTAVSKPQFSTSTSYRAQAETATRGRQSPEWVMVLNATAYIHCGSLSNAGSSTNLAVSNGADLFSEQIHSINKQLAVVPRSNALTQNHGSSSHVIDNHVSSRYTIPTGMDALDLVKDSKPWKLEDDWFGTGCVASKPYGTTSAEIKSLSFQGSNEVQSRQPSCTVRPLKKESIPPASTHNKANIPCTKQDVGLKKPTAIVAAAQTYNATKTQAANSCNVVTVYNSAVSKKNVEARLATDRYDWFNTLTVKADEVKQQAMDNVGKEPPLLQPAKYNMQPQNERGGRAPDGLVWREVNRAEGGCWYHFRRTAGGGYKCTLCNVSLCGTASIMEHVWGKSHQARLDKKRASETEEDLMWRRVPKPENFHRNFIYYEIDNGKPLFHCSICDVDVPFAYQNLLTHIRGRIHREELDSDNNWN